MTYPCVVSLTWIRIFAGGIMMTRFLLVLILLSSSVGAVFPAGAMPVSLAIHAMRSTDASGAFILVKKGKGHGDREERFERHRRHGVHGFSRHRHRGVGNYSGSGGGNRNQPDGQN
jgi:hypothetical protein